MASSDSLKAGFNSLIKRTDPDTEAKVRSSVRFLNETIQYNANEPSLALYRMQEHVQRTLPNMVQKRKELENSNERMSGLIFDIEYSSDGIKHLANSAEHVKSMAATLERAQTLIKNIELLRQQQIQLQLFGRKDGGLSSSMKL